jgi:hypothetical protein
VDHPTHKLEEMIDSVIAEANVYRAVISRMDPAMTDLPVSSRIAVLAMMLGQQICFFPAEEQDQRMHDLLAELPSVINGTREGQRIAALRAAP